MFESPTVFIIDDDEAVRHSMSRLIETYDFEVHSFGSAEEFLNFVDESCKDCPSSGDCLRCNGCLVLDLFMPEMNGLELMQQLDRKTMTLPAIMVSGHADEELEAQALKAGVIAFLHKPYMNSHLIEAIRSAIGDARCLDAAPG